MRTKVRVKAQFILYAVLLLAAVTRLMYAGELLYLWFSLILLTVPALSFFNLLITALTINLSQRLDTEVAEKGSSVTLSVEIYNKTLFPYSHILLHYLTADSSIYGQSFTASMHVPPWGSASFTRKMDCPYRGVYSPGVCSAELCDIFGLFQVSLSEKRVPGKNRLKLTVLPDTKLSGSLTEALSASGDGGLTNRSGDDLSSVSGYRKFRRGDPLKRVNWKLSARTGELQVREFEDLSVPGPAVFLNLAPHGLDGEYASALEDSLCRCAAACTNAILSGNRPVTLITYGERRAELTGSSPGDLSVFRHFLAAAVFNSAFDFAPLINLELSSASRFTDLVLITADISGSLAAAVKQLAVRGIRITLLAVRPAFPGTGSASGINIASELEEPGVQVRLITAELYSRHLPAPEFSAYE